jgi:hypothetical protein
MKRDNFMCLGLDPDSTPLDSLIICDEIRSVGLAGYAVTPVFILHSIILVQTHVTITRIRSKLCLEKTYMWK